MDLLESKIENFINKSNVDVFIIKTTTENFKSKFSNVSSFWKSLKNGLYSVGGISNRKYFKNLSGVYFQLENKGELEIIIFYELKERKLKDYQVSIRIKKLLGQRTKVVFGMVEEEKQRLYEVVESTWKCQSFGEYYFQK